MWIVEGAFDGEAGNLERKKTKLLRPGRSYPLGRKARHPLQLVLNHPKVSAEHIAFVVSDHPISNVDDLLLRPTLTLQNQKNKVLQISRTSNGQNERVLVQGLAEENLHSGDVIALVTGIYVSVYWKPVCCYAVRKTPTIPLAKCAALGLKVVSNLHAEVTHHLTPILSASTSVATSMLNPASFVLPDWLTELLHLGEAALSPDGPSALEQDFRLPSESDYRPPFDPELPATWKAYLRWEASKKRVGLLKGWRFIFIDEKGKELDSEFRTLLERGEGEYETFDVAGGLVRWKHSLARNQRKAEGDGGKGLCIIGDVDVLKLVASDTWMELDHVLKTQGLRLFKRSDLLEAIFLTDLDRVSSTTVGVSEQEQSPLPSIVPNTYEIQISSPSSLENAAMPQGTASSSHPKLRKRVTPASQGATSASEERLAPVETGPTVAENPPVQISAPESEVQSSRASQEPEATGRRKPLVRRSRINASPTPFAGVDDPPVTQPHTSDTEMQNQATTTKPFSSGKPISQTSATGRGLLRKRAHEATSRNPITAGLEKKNEATNEDQPPLKKYRALFEETDPDRVESQYVQSGLSNGGIADSQLFSDMPNESQSAGVIGGLSVVPEEAEEGMPAGVSTSDAPPNAIERDADESPLSPRKKPEKPLSVASEAGPSQLQRPPVSSTQMSTMSKTASSKTGAAPGKPDTDADFLKALASTKKGKRREDEFDREFNNLRISVPEREKDERAEEWKLLADFGDESNLLGNFMVIMEMDVPERGRHHSNSFGESSRAQIRDIESPAWRDKPNFKKFKKKANDRPRPAVELVVDDENDYGMGTGYWKNGSQSQSQSQPQAEASQANAVNTNGETQQQQRGQSYLQPSQTQNRGFLQASASASKGKKSQTQPQSLFQTQLRTQGKGKGRSLEEEPPTIRARSQGPAKGKGKQMLSDVDEDDIIEVDESGHAADANGNEDQPLFLDDSGEVDLKLDLDGISDVEEDEDDASEPPTLRSRSQSQRSVRSKPESNAALTKRNVASNRTTNVKKRAAGLMDDDSDTGMAFTGFGGGGRKKGRAF